MILAQVRVASPIGLQQLLRKGGVEPRPYEPRDPRSRLEHWIQHQKVHGTALADFESDDRERVT